MTTLPPSFGPGRPPSASRPSADPAPLDSNLRGYLDIQLGSGPMKRRVLLEKHLFIGRTNQVQLMLDHETVSRQHAELFCDPFGRWWIRDLQSTNGTLVNDERVEERVLQPSDWIRIGDFTLYFHVTPESSIRIPASPTGVHMGTVEPTTIGTLADFEPPRISGKHLFLLLEMNRRLMAIPQPEERLATLCQVMVGDDFHGSVALVGRLDEAGALGILSGPSLPNGLTSDAPPYISRSVLTKLRETGKPVLASNVGDVAKNDLTLSRRMLPLSVVACPLRGEAREGHRPTGPIDLLYIVLPPGVGSVEWLSLGALATEFYQQAETFWQQRGHVELHAAIERELQMARGIQQAILPGNQQFDGLEVAIGFDPCKWVGGDFVDVVPTSDGRVLLTVADVCGKGLVAAMVASSLHTLVRATIESGRSLLELVARLSRHLIRYLPQDSFVTMVTVVLDPVTGELECFNAGHPPALIVAARDGATRSLQSEVHPAFGLMEVSGEVCTDRLAPGEVLLMYTDGLTELRDASKRMLGLEALHVGFAKICASSPERSVSELADKLRQMLDQFRGGQLPEDDRAFLLARRRP